MITIGYFSGSSTHDRDFAVIADILADVLEKHKDVRLLLAGKINVPILLDIWKERIDWVETVDWKKLPEMIAGVDINLAPLMDTRFNKCKSAIKWLEAARVGAHGVGATARVPTRAVAQRTAQAPTIGLVVERRVVAGLRGS